MLLILNFTLLYNWEIAQKIRDEIHLLGHSIRPKKHDLVSVLLVHTHKYTSFLILKFIFDYIRKLLIILPKTNYTVNYCYSVVLPLAYSIIDHIRQRSVNYLIFNVPIYYLIFNPQSMIFIISSCNIIA